MFPNFFFCFLQKKLANKCLYMVEKKRYVFLNKNFALFQAR